MDPKTTKSPKSQRQMSHNAARVRAPRTLAAVAIAVPTLFLFAALALSQGPPLRVMLYSLDNSGMQGPQYMPELNSGFPRPWDQPSGHPSLSSVQYMPENSTDWYPDQEETEAGGEDEEVEAAVEEGEVAADNATSTDDAAAADNATATEAAPADATAAQSSHTQMLASVKSIGKQHGRIEDPEEWLQNNVGAKFSAIKGGVKGRVKQLLASSTSHHSNRIPDPVEWMEAHYLKHKYGAKNLARMPSRSQQKMASADTPQLWQLRRSPSEGNFHMPSEGSAKMARQQASVLGCKGTHYRRFGATTTFIVAPCKTDAEEFKGLAANRFDSAPDVGTTVEGASTDLKAKQFQHQWLHQNLAAAEDDDFLRSAQQVAGARLDPFGSKADQADDAILASSAQALAAHEHPNAMSGMTSARHGPAAWHTW